TSQAKLGEPMALDALSELMDDQAPRAFYDYIRNKDYGLSPEIPADKKTINQFRRFTARTEGLSLTFEAHLLGSKIEFDEGRDMLIIRGLPEKLRSELRTASPSSAGQSKQVSSVPAPAPAPALRDSAYVEPADAREIKDDPLYDEAERFVRET
ncbi:nucleoid-associated protein, partial [Pseudomonas aeruginosa]|uniref:nucleoid-associated protein n=1 Tax=Pseudomonas aeruginosa TaxID=287 RepID=UPI0031B6D2A4